MLDGFIRKQIDPVMNQWAAKVLQGGLSANGLTIIAFILGFIACFAAGMQIYPLALMLIILNRFLAGLAGTVARATGITALGSYLDVVCDFSIFAAFAFFFSLGLMKMAFLTAAILIFAYMMMAVAYLGQATFTARANVLDAPKGGLVENTEITIFMIACCAYPPGFPAIAALFALLCWVTALIRIATAVRLLKA